jgi:hypothetical protein
MAFPRVPVRSGLVALASGGQTGATPMMEGHINHVGTVATAADSVMLPLAKAGACVWGVNATANSMNMYPRSGQTINALAADATLAIAAGKAFHAFCATSGNWRVVLSA